MKAAREDPEDLMTAVDAARILDLSSDMVRPLARRGDLKAALRTVRGGGKGGTHDLHR